MKNSTASQRAFGLLAIIAVTIVLFLVMPLQFQGPETFKGCTNIHVSSCSFEQTARWHWFGMYHVLFGPEGPHYPAVMNYRLVHGWEAAVAAGTALIISVALCAALMGIMKPRPSTSPQTIAE